MASRTYITDDVYGLNRELPLNYVSRTSVDDKLIENLTNRKHLVIYGSSKQGKTSLRKHCLRDSDYIDVQCSNKWALPDLHQAILKKAGFTITASTTKSLSGSVKVHAKASANLFGTGGEAGGELSGTAAGLVVSEPLDLDPGDTNDLIHALKSIGFNRYIVLEDFHYLPTDTQRDFAVALKAIHEASSITCIIIGVWLEENRLIVYNGDLTGRVVPIDADRWDPEELLQVVNKGAELLNVTFAEGFLYRLLSESFSSVYVIQEACRRVCRKEGVVETRPQLATVGMNADATTVVAEIVAEQEARYRSFLRHFADGLQDSELKMYQWLLFPVLLAEPKALQSGLTYPHMRKVIQRFHLLGKTLNLGNLTIALQKAANLQLKKGVKPLVLDYDESNRRLRVVDRGFLIWLARQDRRELLEHIGFEADLANRAWEARDSLEGDAA